MNIFEKFWVNIQLLCNDYGSCKLFRLYDYGKPVLGMESQGMDVYNNRYIIQGSDNTGKNASIAIIDLDTKKIINEFDVGFPCHVNNINYCAPLLYVSECRGEHRCFVAKMGDALFAPQNASQVISFGTIISYCGTHYSNRKNSFDWFVSDDGHIYTLGPTGKDGEIEILKFKLPKRTKVLTDKDILKSFKFSDCRVYQGTRIVDGKLYALFGLGTKEARTCLKVIDLQSGEIEKNIDITGLEELEGLGVYEDGIIVVNCAYNPTYSFIKLK